MRHSIFILIVMIALHAVAQPKPSAANKTPKPIALPAPMFKNLKDSCTQLDIVFYTGVGGSMSLDGKNVRMFTAFVSPNPTAKIETAKQDGHIMWQINGHEYLTGNMFLTGDSTGYLVFNKDNKEYINSLIPQGAGFLHTHGKKK
jgi:hypothetical protein